MAMATRLHGAKQMKSILAAIGALISVPVFAATYVVPPDRDLVHQAQAVVVATPLSSYTVLNSDDAVETVSTFSVEEVIKGDIGDSVEVREPGGTFLGRSTVIADVPRFTDGQRYV